MNPSPAASAPGRPLLRTVYFIYFFCGLALCFEGAFNPEFKDYFQLNYQQQQYTTFAKNIPFALALFIGIAIPRLGYKNCLSIAMGLFAIGTLLLVPGLQSGSYPLLLGAFFVIGLGFNFQLVAGNPLLSGLGSPDTASSRLNLGNALGAIAQILGPVTLSLIIPATMVTVHGKMPYMKGLFGVVGFILIGITVLTMLIPNVDIAASQQASSSPSPAPSGDRFWTQPKVLLGFVTIFLVLGVEAGLFTFFRNFLEDKSIAGLSSTASQRLFTVYFALFALGRLSGSWLQRRLAPAGTLAVHAIAAILCVAAMVLTRGPVAVAAFLLVGFFVSIFFPTLYSLAIAGLGPQTAKASGLLTMGFLGCACIPVLQGRLADTIGLQRSFVVCFIPYLLALFYALKGHQWQSGRNTP
jgi:FHS family L-fucose permease-like MFS transporter